MTDWHCCMLGHAWGSDGVCIRCGAYEPERRVKKVGYASAIEIAAFALRMVVDRIQFRIDAMNERGLDGVSISKGFAQEIVRACRRGSELLENPEPAQAGLTAGGGTDSANVSEGVTGGGECAVGNAAGEIGGVLQRPQVDDPAAAALDFDYRCDCCDNGLQAEWDFCPYCGLCQREEPSGLCLAGIAANKACRPDDTLKRCTICGFIVDTQYAAEPPAKERRPRK